MRTLIRRLLRHLSLREWLTECLLPIVQKAAGWKGLHREPSPVLLFVSNLSLGRGAFLLDTTLFLM